VVAVVVDLPVAVAVADDNHSGHGQGHDRVHDHDLLRLPRDWDVTLALPATPRTV